MCWATPKWVAWTASFVSSRAELCSHPTAKVLSPRARMHKWMCAWASLHSSHTLTAIPMNLRRLLALDTVTAVQNAVLGDLDPPALTGV
jgi:hypothetical protein